MSGQTELLESAENDLRFKETSCLKKTDKIEKDTFVNTIHDERNSGDKSRSKNHCIPEVAFPDLGSFVR